MDALGTHKKSQRHQQLNRKRFVRGTLMMTARAITVLATSWLLQLGAPLRADDAAGEALYAEHCATCHSASLRGSAHGATLRGDAAIPPYPLRTKPRGGHGITSGWWRQ